MRVKYCSVFSTVKTACSQTDPKEHQCDKDVDMLNTEWGQIDPKDNRRVNRAVQSYTHTV